MLDIAALGAYSLLIHTVAPGIVRAGA
jgi:hypothetical protein